MWVYALASGRFLEVNAAAVRQYGYSREEFLAMQVGDLEAGAGRYRTRSGELRDVEVSGDDILFNGVAARLMLIQDVTEMVRLNRALSTQASLLDKAQDAILVRDLEQRITYWNHSAARLYGWSAREAVGKLEPALLYRQPEAFWEATARTLASGEWVGELQQVTREGRDLTVEARWTLVRDDSGQPQAVLSINTDVTERKKLEQHFLRAQRMESIGTLAGGIAHDLNNVLGPILMGIELLSAGEEAPEKLEVLETLRGSAQRGADMVRQVLHFARGVEFQRTSVELAALIREICKLARDTFDRQIAVRMDLPADLWPVEGDSTQLHQLLLNLCVNARDAMPTGGELLVSAENLTADEEFVAKHPDSRPGRYVRLKVSDSGEGMPQEVVQKIFEPFFTTKVVGKGTGLGLSTVQAIVRGHGGFVTVYSEPGRGTSFGVYLPVADEETARVVTFPPADAIPRGKGELILVVDDEPSVRSLTRQALEAFGYQVLTAEDGAEALALYATQPDAIALVVTDMMMPVMDGYTTIRALQRVRPGVRVVAASGLAENAAIARAASAGVRHFLPKPYSASTLLRCVRQVLED